MKKIWAFAPVKDEEDIIESFVRYNMNIFDGMVIYDNGSNDRTLEILSNLKDEGYNIDILVDGSQYFDQLIKKNELLDHTMKKHKADIVFPLDADEFVCSYDGTNPRKIIEKLKTDKLTLYRMKNFIITGKEDEKELFIPKKLDTMRTNEEDIDINYKCIVPKEVYKEGIQLILGSHSANYKKDNSPVPSMANEKIFLAHYPVRSKFQIINKTITGRLNNLSLHSREEGFGFHQYEILDEIIQSETITDERLKEMSKTFSLVDKSIAIKSKKQPISLKFCKNINLKYTKPGNNDKLLSNTLKTSIAVINHMRDENKKEHQEYEFMKEDYYRVLNTRTWRYMQKILTPYRYIRDRINLLKNKLKNS